MNNTRYESEQDIIVPVEESVPARAERWSQHLQRRIMRLLLQHDPHLFRRQFRHFFTASTLPKLPLLQHYDHYLKLQTLSNELLDDILPRIRRQLSLKTEHILQIEHAPTRGDIDWPRTLTHNWQSTPGLPPQQFSTRRRHRSMETPENILTVSIMLSFRAQLHQLLSNPLPDEELRTLEKRTLISLEERTERELAASYARLLTPQALNVDLTHLQTRVLAHLRPGPNPYRDLIAWWHRFQTFRSGRGIGERGPALTTIRTDDKTDAWLYELWIALECIHYLQECQAIQPSDMLISTDRLQCTFRWQGRRFRFLYNRQLDTMTSFSSDWEHGPASRPDYTIEREEPLEVSHNGRLIWREPSVILDAKYYLGGSDPARTHSPLKKMLGDLNLLDAYTGMLFFPLLPEPSSPPHIATENGPFDQETPHLARQAYTATTSLVDQDDLSLSRQAYTPQTHGYTRVVRPTGTRYQSGQPPRALYLYHLYPTMPFPDLQARLHAILDLATEQLPPRPQPTCLGTLLARNSHNSAGFTPAPHSAICPKPHIGPQVFDLVDTRRDCLHNPRLCHVIGQPIQPPYRTDEPGKLPSENHYP